MDTPASSGQQAPGQPIVDRLFDLSRRTKQTILIGFDLCAIPLAASIALYLRYRAYFERVGWPEALALIITMALSAFIFVRIGLYRAVVRYMGQQAIWTVIKGVSWSTAIFTVALFIARSDVPRSLPLLYWAVAVVLIGGSRLLVRAGYQNLFRWRGVKVAIYGAGSSGRQLMQSLFQSGEYAPMVFLDDNPALQGTVINGVPVYAPSALPRLIGEIGISCVLLAIPTADRQRRRQIVEYLERLPLQIKTVPSFSLLVSGLSEIGQLVDIEVEDLLGRSQVPPSEELLQRCVRDKAVLVTGAGGSIGSELCRQILRGGPRRLVLFDLSEYALYQIERELRDAAQSQSLQVDLIALLGNARDEARLTAICTRLHIDTIYHCAAYKHVPLVEANMAEGVRNNVFATQAAVNAAARAGVESFVLISSDKAVRPTNIMGASKRLAEMLVQAAARQHPQTRFVVVRFGNVLGSSGSVVPLFREQIGRGGPVTVTHPDVQRYFMSIPEAAQLVLQASAMEGSGEVFVLDMGEPVRIVELARRMIRLLGHSVRDAENPEGGVEICFTGLRPGEKLCEELLLGDKVVGTDHPKIMRADEEWLASEQLEDLLQRLHRACRHDDCQTLRELLIEGVGDYVAADSIVDAVWMHGGDQAMPRRNIYLFPPKEAG